MPSDGDTRKKLDATETRLGAVRGVIINSQGYIVHPYVTIHPITRMGTRPMKDIHGIVVHQTGGKTLQSALNAAVFGTGVGAHFYLDKDGRIYQVASLKVRCDHVGLLKPRCLAEHRCSPDEIRRINAMVPKQRSRAEYKKEFPDRYPCNTDSIGIELVGYYFKVAGRKEEQYESVTSQQQDRLKWLIATIREAYLVNSTEIYRHPQVSWKTSSEAETAKW